MRNILKAGLCFCMLACLSYIFMGCSALPLPKIPAGSSPDEINPAAKRIQSHQTGWGKPSPTATLAFLGDIQLGRGVAQAHRTGDWDHALRALRPVLRRASLALGNLESPITDETVQVDGGGYNLCAPSESVLALSAAGINLLSLVNNHADDCQPGGMQQTQQLLEAAGVTGLTSAVEPVIQEINGLRLAFLAFDDITQPMDKQHALKAVRQANLSADVVVVSMHWGVEYQANPTSRQKALAQSLADAGADLIWGHHPHVLQPLQYLERPDGQPPALAAYSLGNALFDQPGSPQTNRSAVLLVKIGRQGVQSFDILPFEIDPLRGAVRAASQESVQKVTQILRSWLDKDNNKSSKITGFP